MEQRPFFRLTAVLLALQPLHCITAQSLPASLPLSAGVKPEAGTASLPFISAQSPGEFLSALAKFAKPDWSSKFRPPPPTAFTSRAQNALTLGSVFADGQLAAHAEDVQQSKNLSKDIVALAKPLGVQTELLDRSKSLAEYAERKDWPSLRLELEAAQTELQNTLHKHEDDDLMTLVSLGAWMRSTEIVAALVSERYTENAASILRQPVLARLLKERVSTLSEKIQSDATVVRIRARLDELERLLSGPTAPPPSPEEVRLLSETVSSVLWDITAKRN
ncbi:MAG: hypothetical protein WCO60_04600 [Verrucomicrobiota bacterium]